MKQYKGPGYYGAVSDGPPPKPVGGRPYGEGLVTWRFDPKRYTEWALRQRGYYIRETEANWQREGYFEMLRRGVQVGGFDTANLDEDGYNCVVKVPIGNAKPPSWALMSWKRFHHGLWAWYNDAEEHRPYYHGPSLWIKSDVYIATD